MSTRSGFIPYEKSRPAFGVTEAPGPAGRFRTGFTLLEVLLVVAMLSVVLGFGFAVIRSYTASEARDTSSRIVAQAMRRAQSSSAVMRQDDAWGVWVSSVSATVFRGDSFASRDDAFDETLPFFSPVSVSGTLEATFQKSTGVPSAPATVSMEADGIVRRVVLDVSGAISYDP